MTFDNIFSGILYGPQGPETRRWKDDTWGPTLEQACVGNDNENFVGKTRILTKYTWPAATLMALADVILINNKGGLPVTLSRIKFHYTPWLGGTLAYTAAVSTACSLRGGKSDQYNHVVGGFAAGAVVGKWARHGLTGFWSGVVCALLGYWYKDSVMNGYDLIGDTNTHVAQHGNPFSHKLDYTTVKWRMGDKPSYWCRTPEEVEKVRKQGQYGDGDSYTKHW